MVKQFRGADAKIQNGPILFMTEIENETPLTAPLGSVKAQSEQIAFAPESMLKCRGCGRMNPPNRLACFYCSHALEVRSAELGVTGLKIRKPEEWEPAFNVILVGGIGSDPGLIAALARITDTDAGTVGKIAGCNRPMPVVRVASENDSTLVCEALEKIGVRSFVVSDSTLMPDVPPVRLRSVEFKDDSILAVEFNTGKSRTITREDLAIIVSATISSTAVDQLEKKRRGNSKLLESYETSSDSPLIDIYTRDDPSGSRVMLSGFDFSCLGNEKGILATENIRRLERKLQNFAPNARLVSEYSEVRSALSEVWPVDTRKDSNGLQRSGFGKFEFGNTLSSSNLRQINRFSRLQWHLL